MAPKFMLMVVFIWTIGALMGALLEASYLGETEQGVLDGLKTWNEVEINQPWDVFRLVGPTANFFNSLYQMVFFKFSFLEENEWGQLFRWIVIGPMIALIVWGMLQVFLNVMGRFVSITLPVWLVLK